MSKSSVSIGEQYNALVMFSDSSSLWFLKYLKKDYRHCFIAIKSGKDWIVYEPLLNRTELSIIKDADINYVKKCFELMGCVVLPTCLNRTIKISKKLFTPFTCVNAVGRLLGIELSIFATPWQLYKRLSI